MVRKITPSKNQKMKDELKAIRQLKDVAVILSNNDLENAFLSNVDSSSEATDESVASDVLSKVSGQESGFKKLEVAEGGPSRQKPSKSSRLQQSKKILNKPPKRVLKKSKKKSIKTPHTAKSKQHKKHKRK